MSSKRRIRRKSCTGKHRHGTLQEAMAHVVKLRKTKRSMTHPYKCSFCGGYHVGH